MKTKVYLWKESVQIVSMDSRQSENKPLNSAENFSTVVSNMMPSSDTEAMCKILVASIRISESLGENDYQLANRLYTEMNKYSLNR